MKAGSWLRTAAKGRAVPIFSVKTSSPEHLTRAVQTILGIQPSPGGMFGAPRGPEADSVAAPPSAYLDSAWGDDDTDAGDMYLHRKYVWHTFVCISAQREAIAFKLWEGENNSTLITAAGPKTSRQQYKVDNFTWRQHTLNSLVCI